VLSISAPLPPEAVEAAARPFGQSRMLPADAYLSPDVFAWEQRHLFAAGRDVLDPTQTSSPGAEVWQGWVFDNASGDAPRFADWLGDLADLTAPYAPGELVRAETHRYPVAANWKVITENYHECYHCPLIHPELCVVSPPTSGDNYDLPGVWVGGSMALRDDAVTMSLSGRSDGVALPGAPPGEVRYLGLLPNLLISLHPDYVMAHRFTPSGPGATDVECSWFFSAEAVAQEGFSPSYAVEFWDLTNRQDWAACESVQRGLASPYYRPGPLSPAEDGVHDFVSRIARAYLGAPLGEG
jgi:Rieske 2Fe-2S family protein